MNDQTSLFNDELNFVDAIDLSTVFPEIMPGTYFLFKDGGPHYFSQCTIEVDPIYRQNIWPFIYRVKTKFKAKKGGILLGSISKSKLSYLKNRYENTNFYWIEDSISHATSGQQIGLKSILMDHSYNKDWNGMRVKNWKEIYEVVNDNSTQ